MLLERRGLRRKELERGQFYQINLYTSDFYNLPDDLFTDPTINWHGQQLGQKGLIAAAGIWIRNSIRYQRFNPIFANSSIGSLD